MERGREIVEFRIKNYFCGISRFCQPLARRGVSRTRRRWLTETRTAAVVSYPSSTRISRRGRGWRYTKWHFRNDLRGKNPLCKRNYICSSFLHSARFFEQMLLLLKCFRKEEQCPSSPPLLSARKIGQEQRRNDTFRTVNTSDFLAFWMGGDDT